MSFDTILIHRDLPIINGFVQVPPNKNTDKTRVTDTDAQAAIANSQLTFLSLGSGIHTGSKCGQQSFLRLPGVNPNAWYASDPVAPIRE